MTKYHEEKKLPLLFSHTLTFNMEVLVQNMMETMFLWVKKDIDFRTAIYNYLNLNERCLVNRGQKVIINQEIFNLHLT